MPATPPVPKWGQDGGTFSLRRTWGHCAPPPTPRYDPPMTTPLDFPDADLPDDDPDIIAGMARLAILRAAEGEVPEIG